MNLSDFHAIFDHFTIALFALGAVLELLGYAMAHQGMHKFAWDSLRLGLIFSLLSVATGFASESNVLTVYAAVPVSNYHKFLSIITVFLAGGAVLLRVSLSTLFLDERRGTLLRSGYLALMVLVLLGTGLTAFLGKDLVFSHGINVRPYQRMLDAVPPTIQDSPGVPASKSDTTIPQKSSGTSDSVPADASRGGKGRH